MGDITSRPDTQTELDRNNRLVLQNNFIKQLKDMLNDFWVLDSSEYTIIKNLIDERIENLTDEGIDINLKSFLILMKEKVEYIITNDLCKRFPQT